MADLRYPSAREVCGYSLDTGPRKRAAALAPSRETFVLLPPSIPMDSSESRKSTQAQDPRREVIRGASGLLARALALVALASITGAMPPGTAPNPAGVSADLPPGGESQQDSDLMLYGGIGVLVVGGLLALRMVRGSRRRAPRD